MIITDEVRCWFDAALWGRHLLKFGIGRKLFWAGLKKQKTKLICTIDNCGFFLCSFYSVPSPAGGWMAPPISSIFCLFMSCAMAIFSQIFFFYYLTISVLSNFVHTKKKEGQENRVDRRWGVRTRTRSRSRAGRLPQSQRTGREPSQRGWMKLCWTGIKVERWQWRKKLADEEGRSEVKSKKGSGWNKESRRRSRVSK